MREWGNGDAFIARPEPYRTDDRFGVNVPFKLTARILRADQDPRIPEVQYDHSAWRYHAPKIPRPDARLQAHIDAKPQYEAKARPHRRVIRHIERPALRRWRPDCTTRAPRVTDQQASMNGRHPIPMHHGFDRPTRDPRVLSEQAQFGVQPRPTPFGSGPKARLQPARTVYALQAQGPAGALAHHDYTDTAVHRDVSRGANTQAVRQHTPHVQFSPSEVPLSSSHAAPIRFRRRTRAVGWNWMPNPLERRSTRSWRFKNSHTLLEGL